jgi:hypothetical protein
MRQYRDDWVTVHNTVRPHDSLSDMMPEDYKKRKQKLYQ